MLGQGKAVLLALVALLGLASAEFEPAAKVAAAAATAGRSLRGSATAEVVEVSEPEETAEALEASRAQPEAPIPREAAAEPAVTEEAASAALPASEGPAAEGPAAEAEGQQTAEAAALLQPAANASAVSVPGTAGSGADAVLGAAGGRLEEMKHAHAGCFIKGEDGRLLAVLLNSGLYDLPGGHKEGDETPRQTALRETYEETGFRAVTTRLLAILGADREFFHMYSCRIVEGAVSAGPVDKVEVNRPVWLTPAQVLTTNWRFKTAAAQYPGWM